MGYFIRVVALFVLVLGAIMLATDGTIPGPMMAVIIGFGVLISDIAFNLDASRRK